MQTRFHQAPEVSPRVVPRSMLATRLAWALAGGLCAGAAAFTPVAAARLGSPTESVSDLRVAAPAAPAAAAPQPWWAAFGEPTLLSLQQAARAALRSADGGALDPSLAVQSDSQTAALYVAMRVMAVRTLLAEDLQAKLRQLRAQVAGAPTQRNAQVLATIDARLQAGDSRLAQLRAWRDERVSQLAQRCGLPGAELAAQLRPLLAQLDLPAFEVDTPLRLPRAVLAGRADVVAAQQRLWMTRKLTHRADPTGLGGLRLAGWIAPAVLEATGRGVAPDAAAHFTPDTAPDTALAPGATVTGEANANGTPGLDAVAEADSPDADELRQVLAQAQREVGAGLVDLQRLSRETVRLSETVRARQGEQQAVLRRLGLGEAGEAEALAVFEALRADGDRLAVSANALALAWIRLHLLTGGQPLTTLAQRASDDGP